GETFDRCERIAGRCCLQRFGALNCSREARGRFVSGEEERFQLIAGCLKLSLEHQRRLELTTDEIESWRRNQQDQQAASISPQHRRILAANGRQSSKEPKSQRIKGASEQSRISAS